MHILGQNAVSCVFNLENQFILIAPKPTPQVSAVRHQRIELRRKIKQNLLYPWSIYRIAGL